jgi:hypothetical protein
MPRRVKRDRQESVRLVAEVAFILEGRRCELSGMPVFVACRTDQFPRNIDGALTLRLMTLVAGKIGMFPLQRKCSHAVIVP